MMQETKCFPEKTLNKEKITNRVKFYSWPYSQPRIVNTVRASSKMGILLGFLTVPIVMNEIYQMKHLLFIDIAMWLSLIILKAGIIPAIRRNQIKYTPSESRKLNYYGLLFMSIMLYASMIRAMTAVGLYVFNNRKEMGIVNAIFGILKVAIADLPLNIIIPTVIFGALPIILIIYPKDIRVTDYHYTLLELQKTTYVSTGYKEKEKETIPLFPTHMPKPKVSKKDLKPTDTYFYPVGVTPPDTSKNTNRTNNSGKNNTRNTHNKTSRQGTNKPITSGDIWETKISKRTRRD